MLENKKTQWTKLAFRNIFTVFFTVQRFLIHFEISEKMYSRDILIFTIRTLNMLHIYTSFFRVKLVFLIHWDSEGDQPWDFFGRNDAKAETPVLWPPHATSWLIGKDSDAGRDWGQEKKGTTEDEMARWHHWLDGCESEWTPGVGDGQGDLACCNSWGLKESDMTERLNWTVHGCV